MTQNTNNNDSGNSNDKIKLIVTIGCVVIGLCNIVIFPLVDVIFHTEILKSELPVLQILLSLLKP